MRAFVLLKLTGGVPELDSEATPYHGYVLCASYQDWGLFLVSGTAPQLLTIAALPAAKVVPLCLVSQNKTDRFPELNDTVVAATRTKLNVWLTARGLPTIPAGAKYRAILKGITDRLNPNFTLAGTDVMEPAE